MATYKSAGDPAFVAKVQDVVGLYVNPPQHAVVLSIDEKTSIQALERAQQPLPVALWSRRSPHNSSSREAP